MLYGYRYRANQRLYKNLYVYSILGAQAQAKTGSLVPGTGLDAKREFLNILEASIYSPILYSEVPRFFTIRSLPAKCCCRRRSVPYGIRHEFAYRYVRGI